MKKQPTKTKVGNEALRILLITPYFYPINYGGAPVVYKTIIELSRNIISVFVNSVPGREEQCRSFDQQVKFKVYRSDSMVFHLNTNSCMAISAIRLFRHFIYQIISLLAVIIKAKPDVIICGNVSEVGWLVLACSFFVRKLKLISYVHGEEVTLEKSSGIWSRFINWGCREVLAKSNKVIVVSNFTREILITQGLCADKIEVITNGVDLDKYFPVENSADAKKQYSVDGKKIILSLTRLVPKKGIDKVIEALPEIISRVPDAIYLIGGTGSDRQRLESLVKHYNVIDHVIFAGFIDDNAVNEFINLADVFVMPNRSIDGDTEGFGLVFLEANACGVPVIGGIDGGTGDAIIDGLTGYRVDGQDVDALTEKLISLLIDEELNHKMGQEGRKWVLDSHSWIDKVKAFDMVMEAL